MLKNRHIYSFCLSTITLLLTSVACVSIDVQKAPEKELTFNVYTNNPTKSNVNTTAGQNNLKTLGVFANKTSDPDGSNATISWGNSDFFNNGQNGGTLFLDNACFAKFNGAYSGAETNNLSVQHPYYWPSNGSLMFSIYSPHISQDKRILHTKLRNYADSKSQGLMQIKVQLNPQKVVVDPTGKSKNVLDLLYADSKDINNNKTVGTTSRPIPVGMKHAQTLLTFQIINPEAQYKVTAVLENCVRRATFYSGQTPGWLPDFKDKNVVSDFTICNGLELSEKMNEVSLYMIPMQLDGVYPEAGQSLKTFVTLRLDLSSIDGVGHQSFIVPLQKYTPEWETGYHYTYKLTVSSGMIEFGTPEINSLDQTTDL